MSSESPNGLPELASNNELDSEQIHPSNVMMDEEAESENEIVRYAKIIFARKYLVLFFIIIFVAAAAMQLRKMTPIYVARATIKYEPSSTRLVDFGEIGRPVNAVDEIKTQIEIIKGPSITQAVIDALGEEPVSVSQAVTTSQTPLDKLKDWYKQAKQDLRNKLVPYKTIAIPQEKLNERNRINSMRSRVSVSQLLDTKLIHITVRSPNPNKAADIANEYAEQYRRSLSRNKTSTYELAREFFDVQVKDAKRMLSEAERELYDFSGESDLRVLELESSIAIETIRDLRQQIETLRNEMTLTNAMDESMASEEVRMLLFTEDPVYNNYQEKLNQLKLQRASQVAENRPSNPELQRLDREIAALESQIGIHIQTFDQKIRGKKELIQSKLDALDERRKEQETKVNAIQEKMIEYRVYERNVAAQKEFYDALLARFNEINVASEVESDNVTIHSYAYPPSIPAEPRVGRQLLGHGMFGFLLGCFIAIALNWLDRSMHDPRIVEAQTGLPNLGILPYMGSTFKVPFSGRKKGPVKLVSDFDPYSTEAESFRLLRTSLQYSTAGKSPQVVMITSCFPSEGKSTASANLAISFAGLGEKTLLIDADLKLPNLHRIFDISRRPGLSDVLTGQVKTEDVIVASGVENLDVMPAGPQSPNPVELLESEDMLDMLTELRKQYKHIILDTAPLHGMSDSFVLANKTDGICLLASLGRTRMDLFRRTVMTLNTMKIRVLGIIFNNQVSGKSSKGYYGYYKSSGYSYVRKGRGRYDRSKPDSGENRLPRKTAKQADAPSEEKVGTKD